VPGSEVLLQILEEIDQTTWAQQAARGENVFFLIASGFGLSSNQPPDEWARQIVEAWPASRPSTPTNRFHALLVITAPLPDRHQPMPEGCSLVVLPPSSVNDLAGTLDRVVPELWPGQDAMTHEYLSMGVSDLADGRRPHGEAALDHVLEEGPQILEAVGDWRPRWRPKSAITDNARRHLENCGLDRVWFDQLRSGSPSERQVEMDAMKRRLWAYGLWEGTPGEVDLWLGMTHLARAALCPVDTNLGLLDLRLPSTTNLILVRTMKLEQQLKIAFLNLLAQNQYRVAFRKILSQASPDGRSRIFREGIKNKAYHVKNLLSRSELNKDENLVSICSFSDLRYILECILPPGIWPSMPIDLRLLVNLRNQAAHGWRFSLREYRSACQMIQAAVSLPARIEHGL